MLYYIAIILYCPIVIHSWYYFSKLYNRFSKLIYQVYQFVSLAYQSQCHFHILKNLVYRLQVCYILYITQKPWIYKILISLLSTTTLLYNNLLLITVSLKFLFKDVSIFQSYCLSYFEKPVKRLGLNRWFFYQKWILK